MIRQSAFRPLASAGLILVLAACSSSGSVEVRKAITDPIPPGKTVTVEVKQVSGDNPTQGSEDEIQETSRRLKAALFGRLVAEGVFKQVLQPGEPADYKMDVTLTSADEVSQGARIFLGVMAGSNSLRAAVEVVETASNRPIADFSVLGKSASHPFSTEAGLDDAVREAVSNIIAQLQ